MNIALWILQILLAIWNVIGGIFVINNYHDIATRWALSALPKPIWIGFGVLQVLLALGLIIPFRKGRLQNITIASAAGLAVISLLGTVLYLTYAGFPGMLWGVIPAVLLVFVAYGRMTKK